MMMKNTKKILFLAATLGLTACASKVSYTDPSSQETVNTDFGSTDLQAVTEKMVESMLAFPPVMILTNSERPIIVVSDIKNKTSEHIDTESITDSISSKLLRSGRFRFVDMTKVEDVRQQLDYQNNSGMVNATKAVQFGRQVGAKYMLYGNLSSIVKQNKDKRNVYYKMTMRLMDLETGLLEWSDEKEIRKTKERALFGI
jgi:uncharacterized protein (TIGR02722 family)